MEHLKNEILKQLRNSLTQLADQLDDAPDLQQAIRLERDRVPETRPLVTRRFRRTPLPELLYLALAHAKLPYQRFDAIRLRTDRARRLLRRAG